MYSRERAVLEVEVSRGRLIGRGLDVISANI